MNTHEKYMRIAMELAKKGEGMTSPNPMVGAVIVKNGKIIGSGYHKRAGFPHAEINALKEAGRAAKGATLYVSLEPCDHYGRTPPCTDAIIGSGIKKAFAAMLDPNPLNNGRGIKRLRKNGIRCESGILRKEAEEINGPYIKFITKKMPYVTVKAASSLDGKIATRAGDSKWITSADARRYVHKLRAASDAVMAGVNTVRKDDPLLTSRISKGKQPVRVIVEGRIKAPRSARIFSDKSSPVIVASPGKGDKVNLKELLRFLAGNGIANILVEGGGELIAGLVEEKLVDKFLIFIAPKIIGGRDAKTPVEGRGITFMKDAVNLDFISMKRFSKDIMIEARPV